MILSRTSQLSHDSVDFTSYGESNPETSLCILASASNVKGSEEEASRIGVKRKSTPEEESLVRNFPTADSQQAKKPRLGGGRSPGDGEGMSPKKVVSKKTEQMMRVCATGGMSVLHLEFYFSSSKFQL